MTCTYIDLGKVHFANKAQESGETIGSHAKKLQGLSAKMNFSYR